jgi:hypothetical protein
MLSVRNPARVSDILNCICQIIEKNHNIFIVGRLMVYSDTNYIGGESMKVNFGGIAFIIGLVLAVFIALFGTLGSWATWVLAALGLVVGLLNVTGRESGKFLIATIAFIVTFNSLGAIFGVIPVVGTFIQNFFGQMVVFVAPAAAVVAISSLIAITRN